MSQFITGTILAIIISLAAWRLRMLSTSGMVSAAIMGTLVFGLGGFPWACLLIGFFISSSLLSRLARRRKSHLEEKFSKGPRRDAWQVIANGGVATLILLVTYIQRELIGCSDACFSANGWAFLTFAGSLAAANADTWATELGVLSRSDPHLITNYRKVSPGTSGGVTWIGILAAVCGGLMIAGLAAIPWSGFPHPLLWYQVIPWVTIAGLVGSLVDSLLGATLQVIYFCPSCKKETEKHPQHSCGTTTVKLRGLNGMDNDMVNLACTLSGAIVMWLIFMLQIA
jgi:uncharacterized protein (TIGR00297 family)